jgi:thioredoxin-related protein
MKTAFFTFCFLLSACCFFSVFAQKNKPWESGHKLVFNIKDCKDAQILLVTLFRDKHILKDSATNNGKGTFVFEGEREFDAGLYTLVSSKKTILLNFIMDGSQKFTYNLDTTGNVNNNSVIGSPENEEMLRFSKKTVAAQMNMRDWELKRKEFETKGKSDSADAYRAKMFSLNTEMEQFIDELIAKNPTFLFSKMQKSYREIELPDPPVFADGSIDSSFQAIYYRTHYWDNFDLSDRRFLFVPSYEPKLNNYFKKLLWYQDNDTIIKYMDLMISKTRSDTVMYRFLIEYLSKEFQNQVIGHDAIFVHLSKNNMLAGKCKWMDEDLIKQYKMRVEDLEPVLIGKKSVEMILPDTSQNAQMNKWHSSYNMPKKYRILWFYDHTCHHCLKEAKEMKAVYDSLNRIGKLNFDVYAVNHTTDIEKWKKYINENKFTWINVGGTKGNVDWTKEYRITSNPQFFIINQEKIIILNKDIPKNMIPQFLMDYERIEAEKERIKNKKR